MSNAPKPKLIDKEKMNFMDIFLDGMRRIAEFERTVPIPCMAITPPIKDRNFCLLIL